LAGLIFSCVIAVFGLAHHGLAIARKTEPAHAGAGSSMNPTSARNNWTDGSAEAADGHSRVGPALVLMLRPGHTAVP
jgi:hypothetical protein